jgi:hypothetical protein
MSNQGITLQQFYCDMNTNKFIPKQSVTVGGGEGKERQHTKRLRRETCDFSTGHKSN